MNFKPGFYLIEFDLSDITSYDGSHQTLEEVAKAIYLYKKLDQWKTDKIYRMIEVKYPLSKEKVLACLKSNINITGLRIYSIPEQSKPVSSDAVHYQSLSSSKTPNQIQ